jgi:hypothetical protein
VGHEEVQHGGLQPIHFGMVIGWPPHIARPLRDFKPDTASLEIANRLTPQLRLKPLDLFNSPLHAGIENLMNRDHYFTAVACRRLPRLPAMPGETVAAS